MAGIFLGFDTEPAMIADALGSTLSGDFASASSAAAQLTRHAQGFTPPGVAGVIHVPYKFILIILGSVARVNAQPSWEGPPPCVVLWQKRGSQLPSSVSARCTR